MCLSDEWYWQQGRLCTCVGRGYMGTLYNALLFSVVVNIKLLLKKIISFKKSEENKRKDRGKHFSCWIISRRTKIRDWTKFTWKKSNFSLMHWHRVKTESEKGNNIHEGLKIIPNSNRVFLPLLLLFGAGRVEQSFGDRDGQDVSGVSISL